MDANFEEPVWRMLQWEGPVSHMSGLDQTLSFFSPPGENKHISRFLQEWLQHYSKM